MEKYKEEIRNNYIKIRGARQHNLKNVDLDIPKNKLIVLSGVSGSGKSSMAFDTIYAEGQRRYVESLSTYARQFLGIMEKPDVDSIEGLSPAISIEQKTTSKNPRSTVGTVTEIYDYLRLLFARVGHPNCPICGREISRQSVDQILDKTLKIIINEVKSNKKGWFLIMSPIIRDRKGEFSALFDNLKAKGYKQVRLDGYVKDLNEDFILIKTNKHSIDVITDKISLSNENIKDIQFIEKLKKRLIDAIQQSVDLSSGNVIISKISDKGFTIPEYPNIFDNHLFSENFACPVDNIELPEVEPRIFSFNSPHGACSGCTGLGKILKVEPSLLFADELSIKEGGILPFSNMFERETWYSRIILKMCDENNINPRIKISLLSHKDKEILLYGTKDKEYEVEGKNRWGKDTVIYERFDGIVRELEKRHKETSSDYVRNEIEKYMRERICEMCLGKRLKNESLSVKINNNSISDVTTYSVTDSLNWANYLVNENILSDREKEISRLILNEVIKRLEFLISVGLDYLTLDREAGTLSGGEAQRIRLASQIGSGLSGVLYVLDEPTIGLHQKDNKKLIDTLKHLRDMGNTVIVVEHDREMIDNADHIIDFGLGAGEKGGNVIFEGDINNIKKDKQSITGQYISGKKFIDVKRNNLLSKENTKYLTIYGCQKYNLKNIDVKFPLANFICITGVSGSGKSTLLVDTLFPSLQQKINHNYRGDGGMCKRIEGDEYVDKVIMIDQSPIGRTPRSNPATYVGVFDPIRELYSQTKEARVLGYKKGQFSFNLKGGRCEACEGQGQIKIEMQFMSDIWVTCDVCKGKRYNTQTLDVTYRGKNISEVLNMTILEAKEFFFAYNQILMKIDTLIDVGLGYMKMGQPATTLSGGEAQRVKLASELSKKATGNTIYILDEPTTGLHFADVDRLMRVLRILVDRGNTVIVIEHNLDVIKNSDYIIDLGPDGGINGGYLVGTGSPKELAMNPNSYTGKYIKS